MNNKLDELEFEEIPTARGARVTTHPIRYGTHRAKLHRSHFTRYHSSCSESDMDLKRIINNELGNYQCEKLSRVFHFD